MKLWTGSQKLNTISVVCVWLLKAECHTQDASWHFLGTFSSRGNMWSERGYCYLYRDRTIPCGKSVSSPSVVSISELSLRRNFNRKTRWLEKQPAIPKESLISLPSDKSFYRSCHTLPTVCLQHTHFFTLSRNLTFSSSCGCFLLLSSWIWATVCFHSMAINIEDHWIN